jgi:hypothetical protein
LNSGPTRGSWDSANNRIWRKRIQVGIKGKVQSKIKDCNNTVRYGIVVSTKGRLRTGKKDLHVCRFSRQPLSTILYKLVNFFITRPHSALCTFFSATSTMTLPPVWALLLLSMLLKKGDPLFDRGLTDTDTGVKSHFIS